MSALQFIAKIRRLQRQQAALRPKPRATSAEVRTPVDVGRWRNDFEGFAALLDIIPKEGPSTKLRPNAIQAAFEATRSGRDIVLKPRQVGLTTWELARDVWFFLTRPVVVCQSDKDDTAVKGNADKVARMFASLREVGIDISFRSHSTTHWVHSAHGATLSIIGAGASEKAAQKKGRSGTIHRLHITECAFFEHAKTTMNALLECVPPAELDTEVTIESTANGAAGFFFEFYRDTKAGKKSSWHSHFFAWINQRDYVAPLEEGEVIVPETDRERELVTRHKVTQAQLKWYRAKVADKGDADLVDQEYPTDEETCWITPGRTFFSKEKTKKLLTESTAPLRLEEMSRNGGSGVLAIWAEPEPGMQYVVVVDPSEGVGGDPGAAVIYRRDGKHVGTLHGQFTTWVLGEVVAEVARLFNTAIVVVERNNHGHAVIDSLHHLAPPEGEEGPPRAYPNLWCDDDERAGWKNTEVSRAAALQALESAHRKGEWSTPDRDSLDEFMLFVVLKGKAQAGPGAHDDRVIAHAIAYDVLSKVTTVEYDSSYDDDLPQLRI